MSMHLQDRPVLLSEYNCATNKSSVVMGTIIKWLIAVLICTHSHTVDCCRLSCDELCTQEKTPCADGVANKLSLQMLVHRHPHWYKQSLHHRFCNCFV